jgi:hypothetical protein
MLESYSLIEYLVTALLSLFLWVLRDKTNLLQKDRDLLRQQLNSLCEDLKTTQQNYVSTKNLESFVNHFDSKIQNIESNMNIRIEILEKNISEKLDIYLKLLDSKL